MGHPSPGVSGRKQHIKGRSLLSRAEVIIISKGQDGAKEPIVKDLKQL